MDKGIVIVATLFNNKKVLLDVNHKAQRVGYRYLTDTEIESQKLDLKSDYIWHVSNIHSTIEDGVKLVFTTIEGTPIVLK